MDAARDRGIWDHINPETAEKHPAPKEPQPPKLRDYPVKGTFLETLSPERRNRGPVPDGLEPEGVNVTTPLHLTSDGCAKFSSDWDRYLLSWEMYERRRESIRTLKEVIIKTVAPHIFGACCEPTKSLPVWYAKLKQYHSLG